MQSVVIEPAKPEDAEVICDIRDRAWLQTYPNAELGITVEDVRLMAQGPNGRYVPRRIAYLKEQFVKEDRRDENTFVAKVDGKVVGFVDPYIDEQNHYRLGSIYVAPEMQGMGIGGQLIRRSLEWYGHDKDIYLDVVSYNQRAIDIYKHFGFEPTGIPVPKEDGRPAYLKELPEIEMVLKADQS